MSISDSQAATIRLYGIMAFKEDILCSREVLGCIQPITVGGIEGFMELPGLPDWEENPIDPLSMPLSAPQDAKGWRQGDSPNYWGKPCSFPTGDAFVHAALLYFDVASFNISAAGTAIYAEFSKWHILFIDYLELLNKPSGESGWSKLDGFEIDLFCWSEGEQIRPYERSPKTLRGVFPIKGAGLTAKEFEAITTQTSSGLTPDLALQLQLEAYRALRFKDYRKAVVETAAAAEIAITESIQSKLDSLNFIHGEKLINKFRTLGPRIELAEILQISLPSELKKHLLEPRNIVAHRGEFLNEFIANAAVRATDDIFTSLKGNANSK